MDLSSWNELFSSRWESVAAETWTLIETVIEQRERLVSQILSIEVRAEFLFISKQSHIRTPQLCMHVISTGRVELFSISSSTLLFL